MPLKSYVDNAAYSLVYVLFLMIVIMEYYLFVSNKSAAVVWLIAILSSLPLLGCTVYCFWKLCCNRKRRDYKQLQHLPPAAVADHRYNLHQDTAGL